MMKLTIPKLLTILFVIILSELILGGGGRLMEIGSLTLRMYLFFFSFAISCAILIFQNSIKRYVLSFVMIFTVLLSLGAIIGLSNHANTELVYEDVKPLSYFYSILFFSLIIQNENNIRLVSICIKYLSLVLALAYLTLLIFLATGVIQFLDFYRWGVESGEFYFRIRSIMFYYKAFLFLGIGLVFFIADGTGWSKLFAIIIGISIILTLTRGYILSSIFAVVVYYLVFDKKVLNKLRLILFIFAGILLAVLYYEQFFSDRAIYSDQIRVTQFEEVLSEINILSFFIGHGFGIGVPIRPVHMEISYLEIFHKQGILGLIFWFFLLGYIIFYYLKISNNHYKKQLIPYILGTLLIYFQTLTNPYLNNPIGMSFVLITLISVKTLHFKTTESDSESGNYKKESNLK